MTESEILYAAAERMREGFSPFFEVGECGCFLNRIELYGRLASDAQDRIASVIGLTDGDDLTSTKPLIVAGWTGPECTDDAVAALLIAADLAFEDERARK